MEIDITSTVDALVNDLKNMAADIEKAIETGLDKGAQIGLEFKQQELNKTYARPIRKQKNGKDAWKRSGDLKSQQTVVKAPRTRTIKTEGSASAYEERLANLPTGPDGVNRSNPASANVSEKHLDQILAAVEQEVLNAIHR